MRLALRLPLPPPVRHSPPHQKRLLSLRLRLRLVLRPLRHPRLLRLRQLPPAPCRQRPRRLPCAATAKKFAVPRWSGNSRRNTTWTSPQWREAARADESARKIYSLPPCPAG